MYPNEYECECCEGHGEIRYHSYNREVIEECPECLGSGKIAEYVFKVKDEETIDNSNLGIF